MKFFFLVLIAVLVIAAFLFSNRSTKPSVIIMLGAPGSGKGTQSIMLTEKLGYPQISTGDLLRDHLKRETELGMQAKEYMNSGKLVPDVLVLDMFFKRVAEPDCKKGFIIDGFPRNVAQAKALDEKLKNVDIKVISLEIDDQVIVDRLTKRVVCTSCGAPYHLVTLPPKQAGICDKCGSSVVSRPDDNEAVVRKRLDVFHEQTKPVKYHYKAKGLLTEVDASNGKETTFAQIEKALN